MPLWRPGKPRFVPPTRDGNPTQWLDQNWLPEPPKDRDDPSLSRRPHAHTITTMVPISWLNAVFGTKPLIWSSLMKWSRDQRSVRQFAAAEKRGQAPGSIFAGQAFPHREGRPVKNRHIGGPTLSSTFPESESRPRGTGGDPRGTVITD